MWGTMSRNEGHVFTICLTLEVSKVSNGKFDISGEIKSWHDEVDRACKFVSLWQDEGPTKAGSRCQIDLLIPGNRSWRDVKCDPNVLPVEQLAL